MGWVLLMMIVLFVLLVFEFLILLGSFSLSFVILDLFVWCFGSVFPFFFLSFDNCIKFINPKTLTCVNTLTKTSRGKAGLPSPTIFEQKIFGGLKACLVTKAHRYVDTSRGLCPKRKFQMQTKADCV